MQSKRKVIRIIARLNIGGPAIHTVLLSERLNRDKYVTLLIYGTLDKGEGDMSYLAAGIKDRLIHIPQLKREISLFDDLAALFKIYAIIRRQAPDILHTHTAKAGCLGRIAGIIYNLNPLNGKKVKIIHTFHGHVLEGYFGRIKTFIFLNIERALGKFSDAIITVSKTVKEELLSHKISDKRKIVVIPLGFDLDDFLSVLPKKHNVDLPMVIGIIGRLVPIKNHFLFLDSAKEFIRANPERKTVFRIIGNGQLRGPLEKHAAELGISEFVEFCGWQKDLPAVYSDIDIVALTSLNEGTPVSLIEAMASARPVITTAAGGVRDLLGEKLDAIPAPQGKCQVMERGVLVESSNPQAYAAALKYLCDNPGERLRMAGSGRGYVKNNFSASRLVSDIERLYASLTP
ncbi:MAG: glycosyltransferase [Candidatus Omnitrophica bacterium]|nr:glycosyltransferase [Candidatus Omnitrophota bacterium]